MGTHDQLNPACFLAAMPRTARRYSSRLELQLAVPDLVVLIANRDGEAIDYAHIANRGTL